MKCCTPLPGHSAAACHRAGAERARVAPGAASGAADPRESARFGALLRKERDRSPPVAAEPTASAAYAAPLPALTRDAQARAMPAEATNEVSRTVDAVNRVDGAAGAERGLRVLIPGAVEIEVRGGREVAVALLRQGLAVEGLREALCASAWTLRETPAHRVGDRAIRGMRERGEQERGGAHLDARRVEPLCCSVRGDRGTW